MVRRTIARILRNPLVADHLRRRALVVQLERAARELVGPDPRAFEVAGHRSVAAR